MTTIIATIENTDHLNNDDQMIVRIAKNFAQTECKSLDEAENKMKFYFSDWFIYRGGNHIAMHRKSGDHRRVLFVEVK